MPVVGYGSIRAAVGTFGFAEHTDLLDLIARVEDDLSFPELIASYNDGSHPYFVYQDSVLSLSTSDGELFYDSMVDIVRRFECMYPHAVMTKISIPRRANRIATNRLPRTLSLLPPELLEHIFSVSGLSELLVSRLVCHAWCFAASRYSHTAVVFRMNADWQYWVCSPEGKKDAELYAFAMEFIMVYVAFKWRFPAVFAGVESVVFHGKTCRLRNYPVIRFPQILPPSVQSLRIVRDIRSITLHSLHYGHLPDRLSRSFELDDVKEWLTGRGIAVSFPGGASHSTRRPLRHLALHFPDELEKIVSLASDARGTPPLLLQMFPSSLPDFDESYYIWDDQVFPLRLSASTMDDLELSMTPHAMYMLPRVILSVGGSLTVLRLVFRTCIGSVHLF
ncbi:uncharacterized protein ARMOST_09168 [Armillaria ostoyae]|uniref:F-box domain-containing protein n=1 Tax=Armillaria ostoyae TaxID=47428 RepID=A0A284RAR7_ARMOS|nr:uncharacterized protein ARMOST_09168 [Armillaria ostoyae]